MYFHTEESSPMERPICDRRATLPVIGTADFGALTGCLGGGKESSEGTPRDGTSRPSPSESDGSPDSNSPATTRDVSSLLSFKCARMDDSMKTYSNGSFVAAFDYSTHRTYGNVVTATEYVARFVEPRVKVNDSFVYRLYVKQYYKPVSRPTAERPLGGGRDAHVRKRETTGQIQSEGDMNRYWWSVDVLSNGQ